MSHLFFLKMCWSCFTGLALLLPSVLICYNNLGIISCKLNLQTHHLNPHYMSIWSVALRDPSTFPLTNLPCGPLGMVLVRTELGQLVMVPQQALAQVQAQAQAQAQNSISPRPATPTTGASFRVTTPQVRHCCRPRVVAATYTLSAVYLQHTALMHHNGFFMTARQKQKERNDKKLWYLIPTMFLALYRDMLAFCMCQRTSLHVCLHWFVCPHLCSVLHTMGFTCEMFQCRNWIWRSWFPFD